MKGRQAGQIVLTLLVLLGYLPPIIKWWQKKDAKPGFVVPASFTANGQDQSPESPEFASELIEAESSVPSAHVASLCEAPDGTLCAAWYGGSREGARDVNIYWAKSLSGKETRWSKPEVLVSRASASHELLRPIKKVGNAVLFSDHSKLHVIYVTTSAGGWSMSSLNIKTSPDGGKTWRATQRLILSPLFNLSELVKNNPCSLSDGGWAIPMYHECVAKFPEILWLNEDTTGHFRWSKTRIFRGVGSLQPALVALDEKSAIALCRDSSPARKIQSSHSTDVGRHWSAPQPLSLRNPDSGLDALRLTDGRLLLAYNDSETGRDNLALAVSVNHGQTWTRICQLETEPDAEFSYPYLLQARDRRIHVVYTWKRKAIKHAGFNLSWLNSRAQESGGNNHSADSRSAESGAR